MEIKIIRSNRCFKIVGRDASLPSALQNSVRIALGGISTSSMPDDKLNARGNRFVEPVETNVMLNIIFPKENLLPDNTYHAVIIMPYISEINYFDIVRIHADLNKFVFVNPIPGRPAPAGVKYFFAPAIKNG